MVRKYNGCPELSIYLVDLYLSARIVNVVIATGSGIAVDANGGAGYALKDLRYFREEKSTYLYRHVRLCVCVL